MQMVHRHYQQNDNGTDYVVGDIHGELDQFQAELLKIDFNPDIDRMFSVGDLIDRGPQSLRCLKLAQNDWFIPVLGNHESMMCDSVLAEGKPGAHYMWVSNGGEWHEDVDANVLHDLCMDVRETFPYAITVETANGRVGITHAEPPVDWADAICPKIGMVKVFLWGRTTIMRGKPIITKGVWKTVHGHTPTQMTNIDGANGDDFTTPRGEVVRLGTATFIDTGACFDEGHLTVLKLVDL